MHVAVAERAIYFISSSELKGQVSYSDSLSLSVRPSVNFPHFHLLLQNHYQTWHKAAMGGGNSIFFRLIAMLFAMGRLLGSSENAVSYTHLTLPTICSV